MTVIGVSLSTDPRDHDIETRSNVHDLVVAFYREVVFDEVAEVDWAFHIPKLIDYWCRVLLGQTGYAGAILTAHRHVHDSEAFRVEHFDRWYAQWIESIDQRWTGPVADTAKKHAADIGGVLARRLLGIDWRPPSPDRP
jgi:hemoglobin